MEQQSSPSLDSSFSSLLRRQFGNKQLKMSVGRDELAIIELFYDDARKRRRRMVPKFVMYAHACNRLEPPDWLGGMNAVDLALIKLTSLSLLQPATYANALTVRHLVADAGLAYTLTDQGLEELQRIHPSIAIRVKAWLVIMPPWLVFVATIAGFVGAVWSFIDLILKILG